MRTNIEWAVISITLILTMFGCSGGSSPSGGSSDTMAVNISGPSGTFTSIYTAGSNTAPLNYPQFGANISATNNTRIYMISGITAPGSNAVTINIDVNGNTAQSYNTGGGDFTSNISYETYNPSSQSYMSMFSSTNGTITLSSIGNVGEKINGTFDAIVASVTNTSDILKISGTFSVTRDQ